jgi:hypothetical protein
VAFSGSLPGGSGGNTSFDQRWLTGRFDPRFLRRQMRKNRSEKIAAMPATPPTAIPAMAPALKAVP